MILLGKFLKLFTSSGMLSLPLSDSITISHYSCMLFINSWVKQCHQQLQLQPSYTPIPPGKCEITRKYPLQGEGEGNEKDDTFTPSALLQFFAAELDVGFEMNAVEKSCMKFVHSFFQCFDAQLMNYFRFCCCVIIQHITFQTLPIIVASGQQMPHSGFQQVNDRCERS